MNKACEICGGAGTGFDELIIICSQCKETREHCYCTKSIYDGDLEKWVCDECQSPTQIPPPSPVLSKPIEGSKVSGTIKRIPMKSKVQYLPPEEAMFLKSGAPKTEFSPSKTPKKDHTTFKKRLPPSFVVKSVPRAMSPAIRKPLNPGSIPRSSSDEKLLTAEIGSQCQSSDVLTPLPFSELQELIMEKCGEDVCASTQKKGTNAKSMESSDIAMKFEKLLPNHPAESPTWRGNFNVTSNAFCGFYDGIVAHPPSKVRRKVYELSKQLPKLLQFELLPRLSLWVDLFEEDIPGPTDIGLFFLPTKSCEEMYFFLVKRLNKCDMLLKSCINGVELLIFSSKNLQDRCIKIDKRCFLWGVFRSCKDSVMVDKETSPSIPTPIDDQACEMEEDMEIDMIGGQEMDNADKVVSKPAQPVLDATPKFAPVKVKEEVIASPSCDISNGDVARDLSSLIERCFERELQKSFDRFDAYVKGKDIHAVKMEKD